MTERKLLGQNLTYDERIHLAQLTTQPGWQILVKIMAEACRAATEDVIRLPNTEPRYPEVLAGLHTTARAMNKFSNEVLDSVRLHTAKAIHEAHEADNEADRPTRFKGFIPAMPHVKDTLVPQSPVTETKSESNKQGD